MANTIYKSGKIDPGYTLDNSDLITVTTSKTPYTIGATGSLTGLWTSTSGTSAYDYGYVNNQNTVVNIGHHGIDVKQDADIKIGDVSLKDFMKRMEDRLALLTPNTKLEAEWDELKELGDRYRELEQQIKDKMKTWDILKREDDTGR